MARNIKCTFKKKCEQPAVSKNRPFGKEAINIIFINMQFFEGTNFTFDVPLLFFPIVAFPNAQMMTGVTVMTKVTRLRGLNH